jgi:steroid 5-alpha reductase family enzyme
VDPLRLVIIIAAVVSAFCWLASVITRDSSWVDRMWSIVPMVYAAVFAAAADFQDLRLNVMAILIILWGARLTFNFARKGGYSGVEDYRWPIVRARMKPWQYQVFNVVFIVLAQNALLVLITLPAYTAYQNQQTPFGATGVLLAALFLASLAGETIADQQQWSFHAWKRGEVRAGRTPDPRFLQTGLFRFSRHPNFFFEQAMWWIVFLFGATAAGSLWQWTGLGALLLTLLFIGSTRLTEQISLSKYPEYAEYQARTSMVVPWFPRRPRTAVEAA